MISAMSWPYEIGQTVKRREIHNLLGGSKQSGIVTLSSKPDILLFTDPDKGAKYGYDKFEGQREDGTYSYTGAGQVGDQVFKRGNKAVRDSTEEGRSLRLFRSSKTDATYVGEFSLADPPFSVRRIPDRNGEQRDGIVFNLLPIRADTTSLPPYGGVKLREPEETDWIEPSSDDGSIEQTGNAADTKVGTPTHTTLPLKTAFGNWLKDAGLDPKRLRLPADGSTLEPDFYVPQPKDWIVEAKASPSRQHRRTAIGQVLDYVHVAQEHGIVAQPVILLPGPPLKQMRQLLRNVGITLVVQSDEGGFTISEP